MSLQYPTHPPSPQKNILERITPPDVSPCMKKLKKKSPPFFITLSDEDEDEEKESRLNLFLFFYNYYFNCGGDIVYQIDDGVFSPGFLSG